MPFAYSSGNPDNLVGGGNARMQDIQGPFYDIRAYLNSTAGSGGGGSTAVLTARQVSDVGVLNQVRAGRQLTVADFTSLGLSQPVGLWNLGDLTNLGSSGAGGVLANMGAVPFGVGINGNSTTAAVFSGSTGQGLYVLDGGAADPFRIKTGSWGCWFRTAKRATPQRLVGKTGATAAVAAYSLAISSSNSAPQCSVLDGTTSVTALGVSDVCDDRWHFAVATHDGTSLRLYIDGVLEATASAAFVMNPNASAPFNIGAYGANGTPPAVEPHYGRVDEAFVIPDVLTDDQVRCLYATKLTHTLAAVPSDVRLNVTRRRKGAALTVADFTTQPLRLHNFTAGALTDEGSGGVPLTTTGTSQVAGADGTANGASGYNGTVSCNSTDAGLPAGTATRSYGCWFKTANTADRVFFGWGTNAANNHIQTSSGALAAYNVADVITGPYVCDGQWHQVIVVEDNTAGDGVRRKCYLDGRLVGGSTVLSAVALGGASRFTLGCYVDGSLGFTGQIDGAFVTGFAMGQDEITRLYNKSSQDLGASPKNAGDSIERMDSSSLLAIFDTLDGQHQVDVSVVS